MRALRSISIHLPESVSAYASGDTVEGEVVLDAASTVRVHGLAVNLRGLARVHWTDTENAGLRLTPYAQHVYSAVEYVRERRQIVATSPGGEDLMLSAGQHRFSFAIMLPNRHLPTSFDGKHGSISYWLKAEVIRTGHVRQCCRRPVTVVNPCALTAPAYQSSVEGQAEKSLLCGFFKRGRIAITARMDRSGYSPGDTIRMAAEFENTTSRSGRARFSLYQVQRHCLGGKEKLASFKLASASESIVKPHSVLSWVGHQLEVPNTTPTIESCSILKVQYFVKASVRLAAMQHSVRVVLPVTIGSYTVPGYGRQRLSALTPPSYNSHFLPDIGVPPPPYSNDADNLSGLQLLSDASSRHECAELLRPPAYSLTAANR